MEVIKCIRLEKEFAGRRGWTKSLTSLLRVRVNISAQWLIGRFVRASHSKSDLINCAGAGRRTLFILVEFFPAPKQLSLQASWSKGWFGWK
ncbi:hypothetical protein [Streptococcus suis]|uniref:hypothetical protein n=1 Tax=Streptococcus suis TaxID=1307 RepID=UPI002FCA17CE